MTTRGLWRESGFDLWRDEKLKGAGKGRVQYWWLTLTAGGNFPKQSTWISLAERSDF
jgi:hypothetical protein